MAAKPDIDLDKLKLLYGQGLGDEAIGEQLGRSGVTVLYWRRKLGLPAHSKAGQPASGNGHQPTARKGTREGTKMGRRGKEIDLVAFALDYDSGMKGRDLEAKYGIGQDGVSRYARRAGCEVRSRARGQKPSSMRGKARIPGVPKLQRETAIVKANVGPNGVRPGRAPLAPTENQANGAANGHGQAHLRVAMFEVRGGAGEVLAAIDAVKAALQR